MNIRKVLLGIVGSLVCLGAVATYFVYSGISVERYAEQNIKGLKADVKILRDSNGVPHIYGDHSTDIMFAVGYSQMQDRMFQFELYRRAGAGELSEMFGEATLEADKYARRSSYSASTMKATLGRMTDDQRVHFKAMLAGMNHYVDQTMTEPSTYLPLEFKSLNITLRHYTEGDLITALSVSGRTFGTAGGNELNNYSFLKAMTEKHGESVGRQIFDDVLVLNDPDAYAFGEENSEVYVEKLPEQFIAAQYQLDGDLMRVASSMTKQSAAYKKAINDLGLSESASRTMVVGAERSASGNALMLQATAEGHEVHLSGGGLDVAGLVLVPSGVPGMGRTKDFGWLITTTQTDTIDTYVEKLNPENKHQYWYQGAWRDMMVRNETIVIAGEQSVEIEVASTVHGPVFEWDEAANKAYSKRWAAWGNEGEVWGTFLEFARAKTKADFKQLILNSPQGSLNITVADVDGNIESWQVGKQPNRPGNVDPRLPTPGTGEYEWGAFPEAKDWPNIENPERGFIVVWNNKPTHATNSGDNGRWGKHFRTYLPLSLLKADTSVTREDMLAFNKTISAAWGSVDLNATSTEFFEPFWDEAIATSDNPQLADIVALMKAWDELYLDLDKDGKYDHPGLPLFNTWLAVIRDIIFTDELGDWRYDFEKHVYIKYGSSLILRALEGEAAGLPTKWDFLNGKTRNEVVVASLTETITRMEQHYGDSVADWHEDALWRYMSRETIRQPDPDKPAITRGRFIRTTQYSGAATTIGHMDKAVPHNGAPGWMAFMEIGRDQAPKIESLVPAGGQSWFINSWYQASRHIDDQTHRHVDFDFKSVAMTAEAITQDLESTLVLKAMH